MAHPALQEIDHRPWPISMAPWTWRQTWYELLFAHWPVAPAKIERCLPSGVKLQQFEDTAWIGVVPFRMCGIAPRGCPDLPWFSAFPELNVRTYVEVDGKPGVWFFSLDATNWLAVWGARRFFYLPYFRADIQIEHRDGAIDFACQRRDSAAQFRGRYRAVSEPFAAHPGTLEYFLTERYCLYCQDRKARIRRADVHHVPWPLQKAEATIEVNTMADSLDIPLEGEPLLHYAAGVDTIVWQPKPAPS